MLNRNKIYRWEPVQPDVEFTADDFFNLNGAFGAIRFNPKSNMTAKRAMGLDIYLKEGKGVVLYELNNTSIIRPFATRLLYNKETGVARTLLGKNTPIYDTNQESVLFEDLDFHSKDDEHIKKNLVIVSKYLRFFFDHVSGKHGFFYICESYEEIQEVINEFYKRDDNKEALKEHLQKIEVIRKENKITQLRVALEQYLVTPSRNDKFKMSFNKEWNEKYFCSVHAFIIFKNTLFELDVNIKRQDHSMIIELKNEKEGIRSNAVFSKEAEETFRLLGFSKELPPFNYI